MTGFLTLVYREIYRFIRVWTQTLLPPIISAVLYVLVFGKFIGDRIGEVGGTTYVEFLIPGLVIMNIITTSYSGTSFSIFFSKWEKYINDILTSPLSYMQMVLAIILGGGVARALFVGTGVLGVLAIFGGISIQHPILLLYYVVMISIIFASLGLMIGLWADRFDHFNIIQTFLITPLIYLGGVFYSIETLPQLMQTISQWNPLLYMINGFRYSMVGVSDTAMAFNTTLVGVLAVVLFGACILLFRSGYKLRE